MPAIKKPFEYFNVVTYTGNGTSQSITGVGFQPDFVWIKDRSNGTYYHALFDSVRGASKVLSSNATNAEITDSARLNAFNSDGFTVGSDAGVNANGDSYVAWCWKASNASAVTNTAGTITSQVSANTTSGFSVVTYTGQASDGTVGHGLGVAPKMIIVKNRTTGGNNWVTYHASLPSPNVSIIYMNTTGAVLTGVGTWNSTAPTSTVFSVDGGDSQVNTGSNNFVAYCFSEVQGYSKFGSYVGNGSSDAPFVYLGFRPKFILFKNASNGSQYWEIYDTSRDTYNAAGLRLFPNASDAENDVRPEFDLLSNGFKVRDNQISNNGNGNTIIYAAFAEHPFKYSLGK